MRLRDFSANIAVGWRINSATVVLAFVAKETISSFLVKILGRPQFEISVFRIIDIKNA
jgi:hypothetical protein